MDKKIYRTWIYHETEEPKIINDSEFEEYEKEGWADSPAKFVNIKEAGIDVDDPDKVQQFGEAIEGVKNSLNGALNVDTMDKDELEAYAREHYGEELDKRKSLKKLLKKVKQMIYGSTVH
jgi:hypothetical protein